MGYAISPRFGHILDLASLLDCPNRIYPARGSLAASHGTLTRTQAGSQGIACSDRVACPRHGAPPDRPKPMPMFKHASMVLRASPPTQSGSFNPQVDRISKWLPATLVEHHIHWKQTRHIPDLRDHAGGRPQYDGRPPHAARMCADARGRRSAADALRHLSRFLRLDPPAASPRSIRPEFLEARFESPQGRSSAPCGKALPMA